MFMAKTTIQVSESTLNQLKNIQEKQYNTTRIPYDTTLDVLFRDKLDELNNKGE
jgi:hypothetical protein